MKFLCLPGAFGNATTFRVQLDPLCNQLESDVTASFCFTQGSFKTVPPPGFEKFFGSGPYYRFMAIQEGIEHSLHDVVRSLPHAETPEETMRVARKQIHGLKSSTQSQAIKNILKTMDEEGDVEGIIGYSEGAMIAASLILDEQRRSREEGIEPRIKCAVFISGWPPIDSNTGILVLSDETEDVIDIPTCHVIGALVLLDETGNVIDTPTCHVIGALDQMIDGSMALYNLCDPDRAELFDHGHGHLVPRDERTVKELGQVIRIMIASAKAA